MFAPEPGEKHVCHLPGLYTLRGKGESLSPRRAVDMWGHRLIYVKRLDLKRRVTNNRLDRGTDRRGRLSDNGTPLCIALLGVATRA